MYFFWPKDFTFVCPTEIAAFGKLNKEFLDRDTQILGGSTDSEFVHRAWRVHHEDLHNLPFPMLSDIRRDLCEMLGILDPKAGVAQRATFIVDPEGVIRFVMVNDLSVDGIRRKFCACSMRCRPTNSVRATGRRAKRHWSCEWRSLFVLTHRRRADGKSGRLGRGSNRSPSSSINLRFWTTVYES